MRSKVASGLMLTLLLVSMQYVVFDVPVVVATGTIYIRADGSIDPPTAPIATFDNVTYTFTDNIYDSIGVERSNIIIDGAGYTLQGSGGGIGFLLTAGSNVTIKNTNIKGFDDGIFFGLSYSAYYTISENNISSNSGHGLLIAGSNHLIRGNNVTDGGIGIHIQQSSYIVLRNNSMAGNLYNFGVWGGEYAPSDYVHDVDVSNTVDGRSIYYWVGHQNGEVPSDAGYVALVNSVNITVKGLNIRNNRQGILLVNVTGSRITDNNITGNSLGVELQRESSGNTVSGNIITESNGGVYLVDSSNNTVNENNITNNGVGIGLFSRNNTISGNIVKSNYDGILLSSSLFNTLSENYVTDNIQRGIILWGSSHNKIFHNNIIDNNQQVYLYASPTNIWDDGYPSGGNYWSDYFDVDLYSGLFQNETGSDSMWDHPYIIDANNKDRYPLVNPWAPILHGIDVSYHQGEINWTEVYGAGYRFAFVKATEGEGWTGDPLAKDDNFEINMNGARAAGLVAGAYHFALPHLNDPTDEARWFVHVSREYLKGGCIRPVLDLERGSSLGKEALSNWVHKWMETVENETGIEPIIYVNNNYADNYLDISVTKYNLWIAHWTYNLSAPPNTGIWGSWDFWQWSNESKYAPLGYVPGISGNVDLDVFNGSMPMLYNNFLIQADIGITEIAPSKTVIGQGYNIPINTTIVNYGDPIETFNITIYANETLIAFKTITLAGGNSTTLTVIWNTSGFVKGNYTVWAYASPIPGETDTLDNTKTADSEVRVGVPGDLNNDKKCNILDLVIEAGKFGAVKGDPDPSKPKYDPNYDFNDDNKINILDLVKLAGLFGTTDP